MESELPIISFDCGHRSLSWTIIFTEPGHEYLYLFDYEDLTDGKKLCNTDQKDIAVNLKRKLNYLSRMKPKRIIIEQQPAFNGKACSIRDQLVYHFCDTSVITIVSPTVKNTIHFSEDLKLEKFIAKSTSSRNYSANKAHARANLLWWMDKNKEHFVVLSTDFSKRVYDIADSFLQLMGWLYYRKEITKPKENKTK